MSGIVLITPVVAPLLVPMMVSTITSVMGAVGFTAVNSRDSVDEDTKAEEKTRVELKLANSQEVTDTLARGEEFAFEKDGLTVKFTRDIRGRLKVCVEGVGYSKADLETFGQDLAGRIVQQFAYRRIVEEMKNSKMTIVEQTTDADDNIHIKLRGWEEE